jgi:hypothetical protein
MPEQPTFDLPAAERFMAGHARLLDRRRFRLAVAPSEEVAHDALRALDAYRNSDGGYGWGLEPDLRAGESQPVGGLHAFEVFDEAAAAGVRSERAVQLCDFLATASLDDGGVPFAVPIGDPTACAPFWVEADPGVSSLQITAAVVGPAARTARNDPAVAEHPWFARAVASCLATMRERAGGFGAYELMFSLAVLDALIAADGPWADDARTILDEVGASIPSDGPMPVEGGAADEVIHPIELSPLPGASRTCFADGVIERDLARLAAEQDDDGGWPVGFGSFSPMAALEWRGYTTVKVVRTLTAPTP